MFEPGADGLEREDSYSIGQGSTSNSDEGEEIPDVNLERIRITEWYVVMFLNSGVQIFAIFVMF